MKPQRICNFSKVLTLTMIATFTLLTLPAFSASPISGSDLPTMIDPATQQHIDWGEINPINPGCPQVPITPDNPDNPLTPSVPVLPVDPNGPVVLPEQPNTPTTGGTSSYSIKTKNGVSYSFKL